MNRFIPFLAIVALACGCLIVVDTSKVKAQTPLAKIVSDSVEKAHRGVARVNRGAARRNVAFRFRGARVNFGHVGFGHNRFNFGFNRFGFGFNSFAFHTPALAYSSVGYEADSFAAPVQQTFASAPCAVQSVAYAAPAVFSVPVLQTYQSYGVGFATPFYNSFGVFNHAFGFNFGHHRGVRSVGFRHF